MSKTFTQNDHHQVQGHLHSTPTNNHPSNPAEFIEYIDDVDENDPQDSPSNKTTNNQRIARGVLLLSIGFVLTTYGFSQINDALNHPIFGLIWLPFIAVNFVWIALGITAIIEGIKILRHKK